MPKDLFGFDINFLKQIKILLSETNMVELEIEEGEGRRLRVSKKRDFSMPDTALREGYSGRQEQVFYDAPAAPSNAGKPPETASQAESDRYTDDNKFYKIKSPVIGTFYEAAAQGAPPYVKVGDSVSPDSTVCIIEAMKVMNEIKADSKGKIVEIKKTNASPVLKDEVIMVIEKA